LFSIELFDSWLMVVNGVVDIGRISGIWMSNMISHEVASALALWCNEFSERYNVDNFG